LSSGHAVPSGRRRPYQVRRDIAAVLAPRPYRLVGFYRGAMTECQVVLVQGAGGFGVFDGAIGAWLRDIP